MLLWGDQMKSILVIGLGRFGRHTLKKLDELGHQTLAVDKDPERVQSVLQYTNNAQIGDSTREKFLKTLGVRNFDVCFVCIGGDFQSSLETTSLLKELGAQHVVARAERDVHARFLLKNGADDIVYPERQLAAWAAIRYSADHILDYVEVDEEYGMFEVDVPSDWLGKTISELNIRKKYKLNILGIKHNGGLDMDISGETILHKGESVLVLGRKKDAYRFFRV